MKEQRRVFQKINKIKKEELATQKVELALIDDVNGSLQKAFDIYDVQNELLKAQGKVQKAKSAYEQAKKIATDAKQKAKELGASDFINMFSKKEDEAIDGIKSSERLISAIDKAITLV